VQKQLTKILGSYNYDDDDDDDDDDDERNFITLYFDVSEERTSSMYMTEE
jgi:hypothetical protein